MDSFKMASSQYNSFSLWNCLPATEHIEGKGSLDLPLLLGGNVCAVSPARDLLIYVTILFAAITCLINIWKSNLCYLYKIIIIFQMDLIKRVYA